MAGTENQAAAPVAGNLQQAPEQAEQQRGFFSIAKGFMFRAVIIYMITSYFRRPAPTSNSDGSVSNVAPVSKFTAVNIFHDKTYLDFYAYVSESKNFDFVGNSKPVWVKEDLVYGDWTSGPNLDGIFSKSLQFSPSQKLQNNGSIYLHAYIVKSGFSPDPRSGPNLYDAERTIHATMMLNKYKKRKYQKTSNLITGHTEKSDEEIKKAETTNEEIISYWHPNITVNLVHDFTQWTQGTVPPPLNEFIEFIIPGDRYKPILFMNTYWNLNKEYQPLNSTVNELNLTITFQPLTLFKWQMYAAQQMKNKWPGAAMLASTEGDDDQDTMKEMFLETSPYLLALTAIVSLLHSVFEMLAFKNDVQFWNNRKSLEGLSVRSVFFNVFQSLIVLLYVLDNETNFVIMMSCFVGLCIELWKITKVTDVSINRDRRIMGIPTLSFKDKGSYVESDTKKFDQMAFRYLGIAFFPLMGGYCIYSLVYHEHTGWYSFVLSMLYGFLLTFGFIMMTPQLFINYKMKSVAHLPWRMLTYKALNTFIDDIFAFVIKMPTMYRLGCLRDDVIFFIFLYQRYIYPIDPTRINEFGFSQEMTENPEKSANGEAITDSNEKSNTDKKDEKSITDKKNE